MLTKMPPPYGVDASGVRDGVGLRDGMGLMEARWIGRGNEMIPSDGEIDSTLALVFEGYQFISKRRPSHQPSLRWRVDYDSTCQTFTVGISSQ